ncbi:MAG: FGGY-family carbohydrate kinase [Lachnospiraceae bacterium]|nr:FGGY-family carbohydrate kinase [Lachnospiraceae bacterium]
MTDRIVLAYDVGTQSTRALLINQFGQILAKSQIKHECPYESVHPDWAEKDADFYYENLCHTSQELKKEYPELFQQIEAISITTIRDTVVCVDRQGKPLRPAILWLDKRKAKGKPEISQMARMFLKAVGMEETANVQYQKSHCNWIKQNEPDIWEKTYKYLLLSGYLIFKLTGQMVDAVASQVGHIPFDSQSRSWQKRGAITRPVFDVEEEKLCVLKESGEVLGTITLQAAEETGLPQGMKVIAAGSDKACEILGLGCISREKAAIGLGTTATITFTIDHYLEPERFIPPYDSIIKGCFTPEIEIFRGYWLISWFKKEFAEKEVKLARELGISAEQLLNQRLEEIPAGCEGLLFQPYFTPNITMPTARGAVIGFSDQHTRIHIYRAIIEGINFALLDGMRLMERRSGHRFEEIYLGGGGSQSSEICQITADMFGIPTIRTQTYEVTGIGCAMSAFVALGVFENYQEAVDSMVQKKDVFQPDKEQHKIYERLYEDVFKNIYGKLSGLYERLYDIYHPSDTSL